MNIAQNPVNSYFHILTVKIFVNFVWPKSVGPLRWPLYHGPESGQGVLEKLYL